jgi:hypothetical protein
MAGHRHWVLGAKMAGAYPDGMPVFRGYQRPFLAIAPVELAR